MLSISSRYFKENTFAICSNVDIILNSEISGTLSDAALSAQLSTLSVLLSKAVCQVYFFLQSQLSSLMVCLAVQTVSQASLTICQNMCYGLSYCLHCQVSRQITMSLKSPCRCMNSKCIQARQYVWISRIFLLIWTV